MSVLLFMVVLGCLFLLINLLITAAIARLNSRWRPQHPQAIGDLTCQYNACSPLLRCAVKPQGPCRCEHYRPRSLPPRSADPELSPETVVPIDRET